MTYIAIIRYRDILCPQVCTLVFGCCTFKTPLHPNISLNLSQFSSLQWQQNILRVCDLYAAFAYKRTYIFSLKPGKWPLFIDEQELTLASFFPLLDVAFGSCNALDRHPYMFGVGKLEHDLAVEGI